MGPDIASLIGNLCYVYLIKWQYSKLLIPNIIENYWLNWNELNKSYLKVFAEGATYAKSFN